MTRAVNLLRCHHHRALSLFCPDSALSRPPHRQIIVQKFSLKYFLLSRAMTSKARKRSPSLVESSPASGQREKRQRLPTTCEWILHQPAYKSWKASEKNASPLLWLHGPPGCGKTFLAQFIVEDIKQENTEQRPLSYFCDANSTPSSVIRSILLQLLQYPGLGEEVRDSVISSTAVPSSGDQNPPLDATHRLWDTLSNVLSGLPNVTLVIDGLDELPDRFLLPSDLDFPSKLATLSNINDTHTKLLLSSRTHPSLQRASKDSPSLLVMEDLVKEDLERFIESEILNFKALDEWRYPVGKAVLDQSEGSFVWAALAIKALAAKASISTSYKT